MCKQKHSSGFYSNQRESSEITMQSLLHGKRNTHSLNLLFSVQFILFVYYLFLGNYVGFYVLLLSLWFSLSVWTSGWVMNFVKINNPRFIRAHNSMVVVVWLAVWGTEISRQVWSTARPLQAAGLYWKRQKDYPPRNEVRPTPHTIHKKWAEMNCRLEI